MCRQRWLLGPEEVSEDSHVDRKGSEVVREVVLGQHSVYEVDHEFESIHLVAFTHLQQSGRQHVEALAVAHLFVPSGIGQQNPFQQSPTRFRALSAAETTVARPVQILKATRQECLKSALYL